MMKNLRFDELDLSPEILKAVADMGFEEATPIQSLSIPWILRGRDVIGQAQTGTGKTAAFGIPLLEHLDAGLRRTQAVVLCPTRELAIQVAEELGRLARYKKHVSILPVYGGQPIDRQIRALKKNAQVVVGTPGRVMDHLDRRTLRLDAVGMVVLDEADEMLDMGFRDDIELILGGVPKERQTVFFSATMPRAFMDLTARFQNEPQLVKAAHGRLSVPAIEQVYFEVKESAKLEALSRIIDIYDLHLSVVFCNTKRKVDEVVGHLEARAYSAAGIHGDMNQVQRDRVMSRFRKGTLEILVATDVAARGIDVSDVEAVFNYDVPQDEEYYVHRIGRTGRAGRSGRAFTFASGRDMYKLRDIQRYAGVKIQRGRVPSLRDVEQRRETQFLEKVRPLLDADDLPKYMNLVEHLIAGSDYTTLEAAGALLKTALQQPAPAQEERPADTGFGATGAAPGMVRFRLNVGRRHTVRPGDIVGAVTGETGIDGALIGDIEVRESCSFVEIAEEAAVRVFSVMKNRFIKGNRLIVTPAGTE